MGVFTGWIAANIALIREWQKYLMSTWGVKDQIAYLGAILYILLYLYGLQPRITSGYRSTEKQRELYNRWLAGDKTIHTPAKPGSSPHEKKIALDIWCTNAAAAAWIAHQIGLQTGYEYNDPVHFQVAS